jgi:hypothetical protein
MDKAPPLLLSEMTAASLGRTIVNPCPRFTRNFWEVLMKLACLCLLGLPLALYTPAFAQPVPSSSAEMISKYRVQYGEGRVTSDPALTRIAQEQAAAMASKETLDHSVLAPFNSRIASSGSDRAAENIAYSYDNFAKTLDQWIGSDGHRRNLLLHGASRVGVANSKSSTGRTYWAMVIAGGSKRPPASARGTKRQASRSCTITILGLCL